MKDGGPDPSPEPVPPSGLAHFFARYVWIIAKNIVGWVLILLAFVVAPWFPGPLGFVFFLLGFGMVNIPGKRRFTSRLLRGIPFRLNSTRVRVYSGVLSLVLPPIAGWYVLRSRRGMIAFSSLRDWHIAGLYAAAIVVTWIVLQVLLRLGNWGIRFWLPRTRRRIRPWLRRKGINLLPPRHWPRKHGPASSDEILEIGVPLWLSRRVRRR